jgi:hypothetical protein
MLSSSVRAQAARMVLALGVALATLGVSVSAVSASDHPSGAIASAKLGGVITISGRVGTLRLNVSSAAAITGALGAPAMQMTGGVAPGVPQYLGLGYDCRGSQIYQCSTVYYVSQATNRLEAFSTTSRAYRLANGVRVGMSGGEASRLAHKRDLGGCTQGISLHTPNVETYLATKGGRTKEEPGALVISGGQVISITLEDRRYRVGALFC